MCIRSAGKTCFSSMASTENSDYEENGVTVSLKPQHDKPAKCKTFLNPKMVICREFVLACLKAYCEEDKDRHVKCLDAFGATGIGGLQWKRHLGRRLEVTINDMSAESVANMQTNCTKNGMEVETAQFPENFSIHNVMTPKEPTENGIELITADANVTMHLRQFHFIHVDPYGSTVNFLDAAFRNIYNKGIMVITSTDVSAIYGKCSAVTQRSYGAYTMKTDYYKEMAARVVLAAIARAAARCNKGLEVLYTVAVEHFVQVAVRIRRGATHADETLTHIHSVLHCLHCEEYGIQPNTRTVSEKVYASLPCTCNKTNPGKTAIELGPMWCGSLFSTSFVESTERAAQELKLSNRCQTLLHGLQVESRCPLEDEPIINNSHNSKVANDKCDSAQTEETKEEMTEGKLQSEKTVDKSIETKEKIESCPKRKPEETSPSEPPKKKVKREGRVPDDQMPPFYYDIHRRKVKGYDIPKANKFVTILHEEGYRACRTTFEPKAVRTNAKFSEVNDVIRRRCFETPKTTKDPR